MPPDAAVYTRSADWVAQLGALGILGMRFINFTFDSSIEIGISDRPRFLDLHNVYGLQSITYLPRQRQIRVSWILSANGEVPADLPQVVILEFRGVSRFSASPHDPELPYDEDTCLDSVTVTPAEHSSGKSELKVFRGDHGQVEFLFRSGFGLKIYAEEAELVYGRDA